VHLARAEDGADNAGKIKAGEILDEAGLIACGTGALRLLQVQPAGKPKMSAADFLRGTPLPKGTILS